MAPLIDLFPASDIPQRMHIKTKDLKQKRRKGTPKYLDECPLYELVQYSCNPPDREPPPPGEINCESFVRLFRRCANGLSVETTAWEMRPEDTQDSTEKMMKKSS